MTGFNADNFDLPAEFQMPNGVKAVGDMEGINRFDYGNEGLAPWRFALDKRPWKTEKVKRHKLDGFETIPVILFYRPDGEVRPIKLRRKMQFEERVNRWGEHFDKAIPMQEDINKFDINMWELPNGFQSDQFAVAFEKFKEQADRPGTPISNWRADPGQAATLAALGIFTVEQFGQTSEESLGALFDKLPEGYKDPLCELHELAIAHCNSQAGSVDASQFGNKIEVLENANERLSEELEARTEEVQKLLAKIKGEKSKPKSKSKAKKKAVDVEDGVIKGVN